jgi:hypothetical protein
MERDGEAIRSLSSGYQALKKYAFQDMNQTARWRD